MVLTVGSGSSCHDKSRPKGKDFKKTMNLEVLEADLNNFKHAEAVRQLVDEYARLPIGQGTPLAARVLEQLVPGLKRHPGTLVFLAWLDRRAVGVTVCMTGFSTFTAKPMINIHDLAVTAGCRGRGVGRLLLKAVEAKARELDCGKVTLEVREDNALARQLYQRFGFRDGESGPATFFLVKTL